MTLDEAIARCRLPIRVRVDIERYTCPYWEITGPDGWVRTFNATHARRSYLAMVAYEGEKDAR